MRWRTGLLLTSGLRTLRRHPLRTGLILLCTALGVAAMIGTFAVNEQVLGAFGAVRRSEGTSAPLRVTGPAGVAVSVADTVAAVEGVGSAVKIAKALVPVTGARGALLVIGVDPAQHDVWLAGREAGGLEVDARLITVGDGWLVLDRQGAQRLDVGLGGAVSVATPVGVRELTVAGLFDAGALSDAAGGFVALAPLGQACALAGRPDVLDRIDVIPEPDARAEDLLEPISEVLPPGLRVEPGDLVSSGADQGLAAMRTGLVLAGFTAVLAGAFLVHNVQALSLAERRPHIGTARALGATRRQVLAPLAAEGLVFGTLGSLLGIPLGRLVASAAIATTRDDLPLVGLPGRPEARLPEWPLVALAVGVGIVATGAAIAFLAVPAVREAPALSVRRRLEPRPRPLDLVTLALALGFVLVTVSTTLLAGAGRAGGYVAIAGLGLGFGLLAPALTRTVLAPMDRMLRRRIVPRLAVQDLLRHPRRVGLTVAALGLAAALGTQSATVVGSFKDDILDWVGGAFTGDLWISSGSPRIARGRSQPLDDGFLAGLRGVEGVRWARGARGIFTPLDGRWIYVVGGDMDAFLSAARLRWHRGGPEQARAKLVAGDGALVSDNLAALHGLTVGDTIELSGLEGPYRLEVVGIVTDWSWGQGTLTVDRRLLQRHHGVNTVDIIGVGVDKSVAPEAVQRAILDRWGASHDLHVLTAAAFDTMVTEELTELFSFASSQEVVVLLIAFLAVLNTVALSIMERRRELALMSAVGATPARLRMLAMVEGATLSVVGTAMGLVVGLVISVVLLQDVLPTVSGWRLPVLAPWGDMAAMLVGAALAGALAGAIGLKLAGRPTAAVLGDRA